MSNQVYCGNLNYDAKRQDVTAFFEQAGFAVTHINMAIDRETGRNKSFAFVEFPTESDAVTAASALDGKEFMGRDIKVKPAERRPNQRDGSAGAPQGGRNPGTSTWRSGGSSGSGSLGAAEGRTSGPGRSTQSGNWRTREPVATETPVNFSSPGASSSVYLGGLPQMENNEEAEALVRELMQGQGFAIKGVSKMFRPNPEQVSRHPQGGTMYCFVEMETVDDANKAMIKCDGLEIEGGARLKCNVSKGRQERYGEREERAPGQRGFQRNNGPRFGANGSSQS